MLIPVLTTVMNELINTSKSIKSTAVGCALVIQNQTFMYLVTNAKFCKHSSLKEEVSQALGKWLGEGCKRSLTNSSTSNLARATYQQMLKYIQIHLCRLNTIEVT